MGNESRQEAGRVNGRYYQDRRKDSIQRSKQDRDRTEEERCTRQASTESNAGSDQSIHTIDAGVQNVQPPKSSTAGRNVGDSLGRNWAESGNDASAEKGLQE